MGGRGTGSGIFPDPDQVADLKATAKDLGYKTLRYTDSNGRQRDIRVDAQGSGTMTAAYNAQVAQYVQLAANAGTDRLQRDLSAKQQSYQQQSARMRAFRTLNPGQSKAAGTRAAKLDADITALEMALRIAQRKGYPANVW
jgi:hypothetical protein